MYPYGPGHDNTPGLMAKYDKNRKRNWRLVRFGPYVNAVRNEMLLGISELASLAGLTKITIQHIIREIPNSGNAGLTWTPRTVRNICLALYIPLSAVMFDGRQWWVDRAIADDERVRLKRVFGTDLTDVSG